MRLDIERKMSNVILRQFYKEGEQPEIIILSQGRGDYDDTGAGKLEIPDEVLLF